MNLEITYKNRRTLVRNVRKCIGVRGLMFRFRETNAILMHSTGAIHSFFVFFPFLCLWLDKKNNVLDYKVVKPFSLRENSDKKFTKILEIPINRRYHSEVKFIVGETFKKN